MPSTSQYRRSNVSSRESLLYSDDDKTSQPDDDMTSGGDTHIYTTRTTSSSKSSLSDDLPYMSYITPRSTAIVTRTSLLPSAGSTQYSKTVEYSSNNSRFSAGHPSLTLSGNESSTVKNEREREKKDLRGLNERLANYIETVRFLEAQNKRLTKELEELRSKWGAETKEIKMMFESELKQARDLIDQVEKDKAKLEIQNKSLEEEIAKLRFRIDELLKERTSDREKFMMLTQKIGDMEPELIILRQRVTELEGGRKKDKIEIHRLQQLLNNSKIDLDNETLAHIDSENRRQTLEEEIEFLKNLHEQEIRELSALAYRDTTPENREYWKNELAQAIRDIQTEYDSRMDMLKTELESHYTLKINEYRTNIERQTLDVGHAKDENRTLRSTISEWKNKFLDMENKNTLIERQYQEMINQFNDKERDWDKEKADYMEEIMRLKSEMEQISNEIGSLADKKLSLELEIAAYRKLLESEETRLGMHNVLQETLSRTETSFESSESSSAVAQQHTANQLVRGEMAAKTTYQRSAKGAVILQEASPDGSYILIENTGRKEEIMDKWQIKRLVDSRREYTFTFPKFALGIGRNKSIKIWSKGKKPTAAANSNDLEFDGNTWGVGSNVSTRLFNEKGEEKASHIQKTQYTS